MRDRNGDMHREGRRVDTCDHGLPVQRGSLRVKKAAMSWSCRSTSDGFFAIKIFRNTGNHDVSGHKGRITFA